MYNSRHKMKTSKFFAALVMGLAAVACAPKEATTEAEGDIEAIPEALSANDFKTTKADIDSVSYLLGINLGSMLKGNDFDEINYAKLVNGIKDFMAAEGQPRDPEFGEQFKINPDKMQDILGRYQENKFQYKKLVNKEKEEKFLAENKKKDGVVETESGLQYKIINPGNDVKAGPTDTVWVKYCGKFIDGEVFDEVAEDEDYVPMLLNRVIKGWTEGMQLVGEGGEIDLFIPAKLGYGEQGGRGMEPYSTLLFNVKIDKVGKVAE